MSSAPLHVPALGALDAAGGATLALWRQAHAQLQSATAPLATTEVQREEAAHPQPQPDRAANAQPATPVRLSDLRLTATHLPATLPPPDDGSTTRERSGHGHGEPPPSDDDAPLRHAASPSAAPADPPIAEPWTVTLARRWSRTEGPDARRALQRAWQQWQQGRRVLLVCGTAGPLSPDGGAGMAALLMGRSAPGGLVLEGARWPVRLMWLQPPPATRWFSARAVKEAAPGQSWQMAPSPEPGEARAAVALQIGPVLESERRWERLGVRLDGGAPFRAALGHQWSLWVLATTGRWMDA